MVVADQMVGEYRIEGLLAETPLGETFHVIHKLTERSFKAVRLPQELAEDPLFLERLKQEALLSSTFEHSHLMSLHTIIRDRDTYWILSQWPQGARPLKELLTDSLSEEETASLLLQIASALDYLHGEKHTFHGGLNLQTIWATRKEGKIHAWMTDVGLVHLIGAPALLERSYQEVCRKLSHLGFSYDRRSYRAGERTLLDHRLANQTFVDGFSFLAPEYKKERDAPLNASVDVYAFGVLAYVLLMGSYPEVCCALPSMRHNLKRSWDFLVTRCLEEEPTKRATQLTPLLQIGKASPTEIYGFSLKPVLRPTELKRPSFEPDPGAIFQTETLVAKYIPTSAPEKEVAPLVTDMVIVKEGHYRRGSNVGARDELPRHVVYLSAFAIDIHPVTNEQFVRFLDVMGGEKDGNNNDMIRLRDSRIKRAGGKISIESGYGKHPVVGVSWYGAVAYAKWVGKRLPTEAEWEVAAYGGAEEPAYPTGQDIDRSEANFFSSDTTPVMSYPKNGLGLYDMAGNVYEWCEDWYDHRYYDLSVQEPHNPKGPLQGTHRVLRGGCWKSLKEDLRCSHRHRNNPGLMNGTYGFRCAADVGSL